MRYNQILKNKRFRLLIDELNELEKDRKFCRHNLAHLFDVARAAYIISLEKQLNIDKDVIYAAALLHDIGRCEEYKNGTPHHVASAEIADLILSQTDYTTDEINDITAAIKAHRKNIDEESLSYVIYMADKLTRRCFACSASDECNWAEDKKNYVMRY